MTSPLQRSAFHRWLPAALIAGLICYWSIVAPPPSIAILANPTTVSDGHTLATVVPQLTWVDLHHAVAYATLALSLEYAIEDRTRLLVGTAVLVFAETVGYGAIIEVGQLFRPDHVASLTDAASNGIGAAAALALAGLVRQSWRSRRSVRH